MNWVIDSVREQISLSPFVVRNIPLPGDGVERGEGQGSSNKNDNGGNLSLGQHWVHRVGFSHSSVVFVHHLCQLEVDQSHLVACEVRGKGNAHGLTVVSHKPFWVMVNGRAVLSNFLAESLSLFEGGKGKRLLQGPQILSSHPSLNSSSLHNIGDEVLVHFLQFLFGTVVGQVPLFLQPCLLCLGQLHLH